MPINPPATPLCATDLQPQTGASLLFIPYMVIPYAVSTGAQTLIVQLPLLPEVPTPSFTLYDFFPAADTVKAG